LVLESDETGIRIGKANCWLWVFHLGDCATFVIARRRTIRAVDAIRLTLQDLPLPFAA
jgi:hypothetical protein